MLEQWGPLLAAIVAGLFGGGGIVAGLTAWWARHSTREVTAVQALDADTRAHAAALVALDKASGYYVDVIENMRDRIQEQDARLDRQDATIATQRLALEALQGELAACHEQERALRTRVDMVEDRQRRQREALE